MPFLILYNKHFKLLTDITVSVIIYQRQRFFGLNAYLREDTV